MGFHIPRQFWAYLGSGAWGITLTIHLIYWLALGRPRLPGQNDDKIPFLSDVASTKIQPVFITGCIITGISIVSLKLHIHLLPPRPSPGRFCWRFILGGVAIFAGLVAAIGLVSGSIADSAENRKLHVIFIGIWVGGILVSLLATTVVGWPSGGVPRRTERIVATLLNLVEFIIAAVFAWASNSERWGVAGVLEWTVSYLFVPHLALLAAYIETKKSSGDAKV